ncbi:NDP-hexose 2,3-dehydratase [Amycolatopsis rhizosphaerae]|uniref:NDP-hexose 2,3-dehydratase n=1 Tax=Amycolatopsis rhizosphaerae TaxID=2053003 RepID=A0A558D0Y2_9PSEU|nr:NDP-hexose 2,3-dehydratase family protein [Amycolatopsis rhizosphaerae]TVT54689.1 NDP-hexose 2,3-dehydratase [Amycolatopsis rhizosphaerae]
MTERTRRSPDEVVRPVRNEVLADTEEFQRWWAQRHRSGTFEVTRVPFADLDPWSFDPTTGNLSHASGRFFTIEGLQAETGGVALRTQPVINQPEIGLLGIVVKTIDGVLHCLMQAKMEPGNINTLQLSPTVQATRSNYTQVHRGHRTRYLEHFLGADRGEVLVDVIQSEQGSWYWRKRNRNMVVHVAGEVPVTDDYRWIPLPLVYDLLRIDNLVNMDARTVLSCIPPGDAIAPHDHDDDRDDDRALHGLGEILSWLIEAKTRCDWSTRLVPLRDVSGWRRTEDEIADPDGRHFRIIGVRVAAGNREVTTWRQPLLAPHGPGLAAFVLSRINGVPHLLVQARPEIGLLDMVEMGPTVQLLPGEDPSSVGHPLLKEIALGGLGRPRYDAMLSEEGGRFYHAMTRYQVIEVGEDFPVDVADNFRWVSLRQLMTLLRHGHYVNIEARTLLACAQAVL